MSESALSLAIRNALAGDPAAPAIFFHGEVVDWAYVGKVANAIETLLTQAGLGEGAVIGMAPRNRPSFTSTILSLLAGRRTIMMVYAFQGPEALAGDIAKLEAPAVILDKQDWNEVTLAALPEGTLAISVDGDLKAAEPVQLIRGDLNADRSHLRQALAEPKLEMLTSGTTGAPKRYPVSYDTLQQAIVGASVLDGGNSGKTEGGEPGTVNFPMSNISGIYSYLPMAVARRFVLLMEKFSIEEWLEFVRLYRPSVIVVPPAGVRMLLDRGTKREELDGVKYILAGTSPIDPATHREFIDHFGVPILLSYGATEFCGAATNMSGDLYTDARFNSVGKPQPGNDVKVVDPDTLEPLPAGETGLLLVKIGALGQDYIRTTDLGQMDDEGFLWIKGRVDGMILRGGFKIMPSTVEAALNSHPSVSLASVVGIADARLGQVPVAAVELKPGAPATTPAELEAHIRTKLPSTNIPTAIKVVDALPRTPSMKVDMRAMRALFEPQEA